MAIAATLTDLIPLTSVMPTASHKKDYLIFGKDWRNNSHVGDVTSTGDWVICKHHIAFFEALRSQLVDLILDCKGHLTQVHGQVRSVGNELSVG